MVKKVQKAEKELIRRDVTVDRVAKVVKGGKRFSFSALVVVGDGRGKVGYASGKAKEAPEALRKAMERASKNMVKIHVKEGRTLHRDITKTYGAAKVHLRSAKKGTGIIAGGPMRAVFEAAGVQDVVAKAINSSNARNLVKATVSALMEIETPRMVAMRRGKKPSEIFGQFLKSEPLQDSTAVAG